MTIIFMYSLQKAFLQIRQTLPDRKTTVLALTSLWMVNLFKQACYKCIYNAFLIKKFDLFKMNQLLNQICQIYFAHSSYVERINGTAKNCSGIMRRYLMKNDITIDKKF